MSLPFIIIMFCCGMSGQYYQYSINVPFIWIDAMTSVKIKCNGSILVLKGISTWIGKTHLSQWQNCEAFLKWVLVIGSHITVKRIPTCLVQVEEVQPVSDNHWGK